MLDQVYQSMLERFGRQNWWPGQTPFEIAVGAILTQNTNWQNVERAIANLRRAGRLDPHAMAQVPEPELAELIRPAGYFRVKARRLLNFVRWLEQQYDGSMERLAEADLARLREQLLSLSGIGPETADSILLYAAGKPTFVVDAYTYRIATRHGWVEPEVDYHGLKEYFEQRLPEQVALWNDMHAQFVQVGKRYCRRRQPECSDCPLRQFLPDGGPIAFQ